MLQIKHYSVKILGSILLFLTALAGKAQPIISSFFPTKGPIGVSVTISGNNFNTDAASNIVFFGATRASVTAASSTSLTVVVPAGATYQPISVINTGTNLIGSSLLPFEVTFNAGVGQTITPTSFNTKIDFATGNNPAGIVAFADVDGDGKPDMIVVNRATNTFSVLRNTSSLTKPSFATKVDFATDSTPSSVTIGDLDGDGKQDIVITNMFTNKISVYRNTATSGAINAASLAAKVSFIPDSISLPTSVAIGDFDGDGKPELAVVNSYNNTVSILKNISKAGTLDSTSFAPPIDFTTGLGPTSVAISDIDGDGKPDLIISNFNAKSISILQNKATLNIIDSTSFAAKVDFTVGNGPNALTIGDLNSDGKPDILVANQGANTISILQNTATAGNITAASLATKVDISSNGASPYYVSVGNIDSDSLPDIVVANLITNNISVIKNLYTTGNISAASFDAGVNFTTSNFPFSAAIADVDGDGQADLAVPNYGKNVVSIYTNALSNALPVKLISFSGKYESTKNALLTWKSATEINAAYYLVQRSTDGSNFTTVGKQNAVGNASNYTYSDALSSIAASTVYYRLVAVDVDGTKTNSSVIAISINNNASFSVYPNPANSFINVRTNSSAGYNLLVVTDMAGHTVLTHKMQGSLVEQIALGTLAKGTYTVSLFTLNGKQSQQIIISQ